MADEQTVVDAVAAAATPKRKTAARRTGARKTTARKAPAQRKSTVRKASRKIENAEKSAAKFADRAQEASRRAFLASLGFYGKAFDQVQEQFQNLQDQMEDRRHKAADLYDELVKRGEKVEADARDAIEDIELPSLNSLTDRKALEAKLEKARARFEELKGSFTFKSAA
ncbi:MAG: hypothetical protein ACK5HY_00605 [Parahaliea sp.]